MQSQIVLRKIASAAVHLAGLSHAAGDNLDTGVEREAVAFGPGELKADPMASWNPMISQ